ncbi:uncharacterized protein LOC128219055 [Mya arenaria]|uniref:uncharacterized protein LOC128219055 n=1 Tax=Mya arenaria TaxID=6604 RepID=UPI0022E3ECCB|nr:uncharacterized protein LOC128219055 [Mya arenaria]XP_052782827.1 uncharacterized protein LOC128219055 [Mya arenaria]XP_052782828.1 uncharacterized protein LOC128219055 [Mya arenaria]
MGPNECDECCYGCLCSSCGYVFCCTKMQKSTRIKTLWAWLFVSMTTSCLVLGFIVFSPDYPLVAPSDMRPIVNNVDFLFCEVVNVVSPGITFDGYVVSKQNLQRRANETWDQRAALSIDASSFNYFSFYFLSGSEIRLQHCSRLFVTFYFIQGRDNFNFWKQYSDCNDCYLEKIYIQPSGDDCSDMSQASKLGWIIPDDDEYFVIYASSNLDATWINVQFYITRTVYELENAASFCINELECNIVLRQPDDVAVISVNQGNIGLFNHSKLTTKCEPRIWAYLILHGIPVLILGILFSIVIQKCCRNPDQSHDRLDETTSLLYGQISPPEYRYVAQSPPKYEDIVRDIDPPSYTEVLVNSHIDEQNIASTTPTEGSQNNTSIVLNGNNYSQYGSNSLPTGNERRTRSLTVSARNVDTPSAPPGYISPRSWSFLIDNERTSASIVHGAVARTGRQTLTPPVGAGNIQEVSD